MYVISYNPGCFHVGRIDDGERVDWWWDVQTSAWRRSQAVCAGFNCLASADELVRRMMEKDAGPVAKATESIGLAKHGGGWYVCKVVGEGAAAVPWYWKWGVQTWTTARNEASWWEDEKLAKAALAKAAASLEKHASKEPALPPFTQRIDGWGLAGGREVYA